MLGIFLDQETTGLDCYRHSLLDIAFKIIDLETGEEKASYESVISQPEAVWANREPSAIAVNGFSYEDLQHGKPQEVVAQDIIDCFTACEIKRKKAFFICANPSFDRPFFYHLIDCYTQEKLSWPYHWYDLASMYWSQEIQKCKKHELGLPDELLLSKDQIAINMGLSPEEKPHRAMQGVEHLLECYKAVVGFLQPVTASDLVAVMNI